MISRIRDRIGWTCNKGGEERIFENSSSLPQCTERRVCEIFSLAEPEPIVSWAPSRVMLVRQPKGRTKIRHTIE